MKTKAIAILILFFFLLLLSGCEYLSTEPTKGKVHYVVVALDYENASNINSLEGPLNDGQEFAAALDSLITSAGRIEGSKFLMVQEGPSHTNETISDSLYPSVDHVTSTIENLVSLTSEDDLTIFFYSGHGEADTGKLILGTTTGTNTEDDRMSPETLLSLMNTLEGKKLLLIDNCYSGNYVEESSSSLSGVYSDYDYYAKYFSDDTYELSDLYVLSASSNNSESWEAYFIEDGHQHGYFTYVLLEGLGWPHSHSSDLSTVELEEIPPASSKSKLSVDDLYTYVLDNQTISSSTLIYPHQHPMTNGGAMDLVLFNF
jgi:hypothetical protein